MATPVRTVAKGGIPVVVAAARGLPVSEALAGIAISVAANGYGLPVTYVGAGPDSGPPLNTVPPVASGVTMPGSTLTTTNGSWFGATPITYTYQWYEIEPSAEEGFKLLLANGADKLLLANATDHLLLAEQLVRVNATDVAVPGATSQSFVIPADALGSYFYCEVTATNAAGSASAISNMVGPVTIMPIAGHTLALDFVNNISVIAGVEGNATAPLTVTRASVGYAESLAGVWTQFAANVARRTDKGLLIEEARTNNIRNNSMQGAVAGTPGTPPTNWSIAGGSGMSTEIVGVGVENGVEYVDVRWFGTASISTGLRSVWDANNQAVAAVGQAWTHSGFYKLAAGSLGGATLQVEVREFASGVASGGISGGIFTPGATLARFSHTRTLTDATCTHVQPSFRIGLASGITYDFTLRIGWPQLEQGAFATSPIRTTTAAVTRAADGVIVNAPLASWFAEATGSMFAELLQAGFTATSSPWSISDGTTSNRHQLNLLNTSKTQIQTTTGGSTVASMTMSGTLTANAIFKNAYAYAVNNFAVSTNGEAVATDNLGTPPSGQNSLKFASAGGITTGLAMYLRRLAYYPNRLSNAQLQQLTA